MRKKCTNARGFGFAVVYLTIANHDHPLTRLISRWLNHPVSVNRSLNRPLHLHHLVHINTTWL